MAIPGIKEKQIRALRESGGDDLTIPDQFRRGHPDCVVKSKKGGVPAGLPVVTTDPPPFDKPAPVSAKEPSAKAPVPAPAREQSASAPTQEKDSVMRTQTTRKTKTRTKISGKTSAKTATKIETIGNLLRRPGGCTAADVKKATGWPSVSMPAMATALGVELVTDKKPGELTRYSIKANKARA